MTYLLNINERAYAVDDFQFRGLESKVLAAVQAGGAFLDVIDREAGLVRVLVTGSSSVRARHQSIAEELSAYEVFPEVSYLDSDA